jgi:hypothetical protein
LEGIPFQKRRQIEKFDLPAKNFLSLLCLKLRSLAKRRGTSSKTITPAKRRAGLQGTRQPLRTSASAEPLFDPAQTEIRGQSHQRGG